MIKIEIYGHKCFEDEILNTILYELTPRQQCALLMLCIKERCKRVFGMEPIEKDRLASFVDRCWDTFVESVIVELVGDVESGRLDEYIKRDLRIYKRDVE